MRKVFKILNLKMDKRKKHSGFYRLARLLLLMVMIFSLVQAERVSRLLNSKETAA
jgi:hypothetical protein